MVKNKSNSGHHKISEALKKIKNEASAKEHELIDLISSIYENLKETQERAVDKVKDTAHDVNTSVHLHPWHYIGGAVILGFLTGLFVRR